MFYIINNYKQEYDFASNQVNKLDLLTSDILHKLELEKLTYKERAKLATKLRNVRQDRRHYKNVCYVYQPLISMKPTMSFNAYVNIIGTVRNRIINKDIRSYKPRIKEIVEN